jgi:hypothetical protein
MNKMMNEDIDIENSGIMQGFLDALEDDDEGDDEDERSPEEMLDRRPDTPEILMNNLRGDMRSIDARRDELADLVGYAAAAETPETVLAMLQPVLAQQGGGGIGALPQSAPMAEGPQPPMMEGMPGMPPPGMPPLPEGAPPMMPGADMMAPPPQDGGIAALLAGAGGAGGMPAGMPPGMPPSDQPPIQMARGGYVQRFNEGSDEDGVTPVDEESSSLGFTPPPEMVANARAQFLATMQQQPTALPNLRTAAAERAKVYQDVLGDNTDSREAQMLLSLGQRAFNYAANVDDAGRPLRGSGISRLAGAVRTLPGEMAKFISASDKEQRQTKLLGLQAAEKDIESIRASNLKLLEMQRKGYADVLKNAGKTGTSPFGSSLAGRSLDMFVRYAPLYAKGELDEESERYFLSAVKNYTQPTFVQYKDPDTDEIRIREQRNELPEFVGTALNARKNAPPRPVTVTPPAPAASTGGPPVVPTPAPTVPVEDPVVGMGADPATLPENVRPVVQDAPLATFFDLSETGTGFVPVLVSGIVRRIPLEAAGSIKSEFQQGTTMLENMRARVVNVLQENPRFAEGERTQIQSELDNITPRMLTNKQSYINSLVALDSVFESIGRKSATLAQTPKVGSSERQNQVKKTEDVNFVRDLLGVKSRKIDNTEAWKAAPPGEYLVYDPSRRIYVYARKRGTQ